MRPIIKRMLPLFLALLMVIGAVPAASAGEAGDLPFVELIWHGHQFVAKDNERVLALANEYIKEKLNCTIKFVTADDSTVDQKFSVVLASGEQSDIMWTSNHRNDVFTNISKGAFLPLNDLLDQYAPSMKATIPQYAWDATNVKGELYAVPGLHRFTMYPVLLLRKDIVDSVGYDMSQVKTIFDLDPLFDKIKEKYPDKICVDASQAWLISFPICGIFDRIEKYSTVGVWAEGDNTAITAQFLTPFAQELFQLARKWYLAGYLDPNNNAIQDSTGDRVSGKLAGWFTQVAYDGAGSADVLAKFGTEAYEIPCTEYPPLIATNTMCGSMNAIPISSKNPERAMMVLELIFNDKYLQDLFLYGIEGEHYTRDADGRISPTEKTNDYLRFDIPDNYYLHSVYNNFPLDYAERVAAYNDSAAPSPLIGFTYDSTQSSHLLAACKSVWDEYFVTLAGGMLDYDVKYPEFVAKMKQAGIEELIADVQKQADAFLAGKQ